ncbi:tail fiber domain-containing protein [sulfur-oxidizing endosymbiont of Gigantopelta aegis]|uniref:tail fiber domain-containing protein n=1 Tax=sulfur-oxidizing endosymbiont of Gigantopelta aegis TaxID=2794934 RepID=UPI0018DCCCD0|nr:tail fiber domain-containing protein [sulfur-oxidizing endosymbiont of Gigantopelta aegis]
MHIKIATLSLMLMTILSSYVQAVSLPNTMTNGSVADADEINANFTALGNAINDLEGGVFVTNNISLSNNDNGLRNTIFGYFAGKNLLSTALNNTAIGYKALNSNTSGDGNIANGAYSLYKNTSGSNNMAQGTQALTNNTVGSNNIAKGYQALYSNTRASNNIANGNKSLYYNTQGQNNIANGNKALFSNTTGNDNIATGYQALISNAIGRNNIAMGYQALLSNTTGQGNIAMGNNALFLNTTAYNNIAIGHAVLSDNTTGVNNTAVGSSALLLNTTGYNNTALGDIALIANKTGYYNTAVGYDALNINAFGYINTALGVSAGPTSDNLKNTTALGYDAKVEVSDKVRIGNTNVSIIEGQVAFSASSDRRLKEDITTTTLGVDFINDLNPVQYHRINNENTDIEMGIIAQELAKVLKKHQMTELGMINQVGDGYMSVRYNDLFAPLIKSVQELSAENTRLKVKTITMETQIFNIKKELDELKKLLMKRVQH